MKTDMGFKGNFISVKDFIEYHGFWMGKIKSFLDCPLCRKNESEYLFLSSYTLRSITIRCVRCGFTFKVNFRQLHNALIEWMKIDSNLNDSDKDNLKIELNKWDKTKER